MLRILEIGVIAALVVWGAIKLVEFFSGWKLKRKKASALEELAKQAEKVAQEKKDILEQTKKQKETLDNINNNLN